MHESSDDKVCNILPGIRSRKNHTSRRDAFDAVNSKTIGSVDYQTGEIETNFEESDGEYEKSLELNQNIGYLKVRPGMKVEELDFILERDYDGLIIEGTGLGHMPVNSFDEMTEHHEDILDRIESIAEDTLVVMSSQCVNGRVNMNVYDAGVKIKNAGVVGAEDMHPELAYVKLMWSLGQTENIEEARELFRTNINGEIGERSNYIG